MPIKIRIYGRASQKFITEFYVTEEDCEVDLLTFLRGKEIPIASSCFGEGVCKKCQITINNENHLACIKNWKEIINEVEFKDNIVIEISYL